MWFLVGLLISSLVAAYFCCFIKSWACQELCLKKSKIFIDRSGPLNYGMGTMRKPRSVKTRINKLIRLFGGDMKEIAKVLNCELSYVYKMRDGQVPGKFLYKHIVDYCDKLDL